MSFSALRNRRPSETIVGGLSRIVASLFGPGAPSNQLSSDTQVLGENRFEGGVYNFHEGDLFTPGTGNWVMDPSQESALQTVWGHGFLRRPNSFNPFSAPLVFSAQTVVTNGIGGLMAGQTAFQPLLIPAPEQGS